MTNKSSKKRKKLPKFWAIFVLSLKTLKQYWRQLGGVTIVYAALYFLLVLGLTVSYSFNDIKLSVEESLGAGASVFAKNITIVLSLFSGGLNAGQSDATTLLQFLLFIVASMAIIWVLRHMQSHPAIKLRDAYYTGNAQIVPFTLVVIMLLLCFVPAIIGSSIFGVAQIAGAGGIELLITGLIAGIFLFFSLLWVAAWMPAVYIVSLPSTRPITAIKSAAKLTKKNRLWILKNIALFSITTFIAILALMLPIVLLVPPVAIIAAFACMFLVFTFTHIFSFNIYKNLLDE